MNINIVNESIAILKKAVSLKKGIVFSTSLGIEDQVITHLICRNSMPVEFFTLDTGRLFPETLNLIRETENTYQIKLKYITQSQKRLKDTFLLTVLMVSMKAKLKDYSAVKFEK